MQGAADLAARAALTAGAGRVYQHLLANGPPAALSPEVMRSPGGWLADAAALSRSTVVCGCGGGAAVAAALPTLLQHAGRLVLDADALNGIASDHALQALSCRPAGRQVPPRC
jgi:NAD(P)H-hydrate repair Nnr-like enzyme with NAD(P)H-hydrate dehydratase domain